MSTLPEIPKDLEQLLQEVATGRKPLSIFVQTKLLTQLDKIIHLTMRRLVNLQNLRDAIAKRYPE
jgi:hypothetical protein